MQDSNFVLTHSSPAKQVQNKSQNICMFCFILKFYTELLLKEEKTTNLSSLIFFESYIHLYTLVLLNTIIYLIITNLNSTLSLLK